MPEQFKTVDWVKGSNIYEVNIRQYTKEGTFAAFQKELARLKAMGIEILWLMPITPISAERRQGTLGSYYACSDYTTTNPEFGSVEDFKALVADAHAQGFKVIFDWVANHTGWDHVWTKDHPDFYKEDEDGNFYDSYGWIDVIDLDYTNEDLRTTMIDCMRFWINECDIDGFRCDMAHLVPLDFWAQARIALDKEKELFWLAETEEPSYHDVFDASYAWEMLHAMEAVYRGETNADGLTGVLEKYKAIFPEDALRACFTTNHDENSHSGSEYERLGESAKTFAVLCATLPGSLPLIYSGQELPNTKRLKFFEKDEIEWTGRYDLHDFYKTLLQLRKNNAFLTGEYVQLATNADDKVLAFTWTHANNQMLVLLNLSWTSYIRFNIESEFVYGRYKNAFSGIELEVTKNNFELQAWEHLVYVKCG